MAFLRRPKERDVDWSEAETRIRIALDLIAVHGSGLSCENLLDLPEQGVSFHAAFFIFEDDNAHYRLRPAEKGNKDFHLDEVFGKFKSVSTNSFHYTDERESGCESVVTNERGRRFVFREITSKQTLTKFPLVST